MESELRKNEPIAIIGSSCRFPGGASSPSKLWSLLKQPRDVLRDIPKHRLGLGAFYNEDGEHHGSTNVVAKAYLLEEDPRLFDAPFFNVNPMEADAMDPQQRLLLEGVYECIESAGYPMERMQGSATSVYVGCMTNDYGNIQTRDLELINRYHGTGATPSILSNRISYFFDFRGPSVTLDTACSSSLAALHFAVQSLRNGESTSSIVGGVNLIFDTAPYVSESKLHMLSPTSRSRMWDTSADGYARGEGVSAIMLKTLPQALADGDNIECIIRETGMNSDGRTTGMTMPSGDAQAKLIRQTYARAGLDLRNAAERPQYFEAHGTGTMAGDPQEARGIFDAFFGHSEDNIIESDIDKKLLCGSVKTVIGHLEGCAGLAGLLKTSLALQHGVIPPNMLFKQLNPDIQPYYHRLRIPTAAIPWPSTASPRRASVNSFGFGGTNVHVIIEQYIGPSTQEFASTKRSFGAEELFAGPLLLSACTEKSLAANIDALAGILADEDHDIDLDDLSFSTQVHRTTFPHRIFFPGGSREELLEASRAACATTSELGARAPSKLKWHTPGILGIFTGQGAQWATMGRDMIRRCHAFRVSIEACEAALQSLPDAPSWSLELELLKEQSESRLYEAALSQPLCTAIQIALVDTLGAAGLSFRGVVGHSSGEIAATYAAGLLSACDAMRVAYYRGLHAHLAQGQQGQQGAMLAVGLGIDDAEIFCKGFNGQLSVAASNSSTSTTLSGDVNAVHSAKAAMDEKGVFARLLKVDTAYHSSHMLPCAKPYLESLKACDIQVRPPNEDCIWISSVHGHAELLDDPEDLSVLADQYWVDNMCQTVLFSEAVQCSLWRAGPFDLAVEVGAHPALKGPATQIITATLGVNASVPYTATLQRDKNDVKAFSASLGSIWTTLGTWVDFNGWRKAYLGPGSPQKATVLKGLPSYSWSHDQVFWKESRASSRYRLAERPPHELLGRRAADDSEHEMRWRNILKVNELPWTRGHVFGKAILFPTTSYIALALEAAAEFVGLNRIRLIEIRDLAIPRALVLEDNHNSGVEMVFSVRRQPVSDSTTIEADFTCSSSVNGGTLEKNCSGRLVIELLQSNEDDDDTEAALMPSRCPARSGTTFIDGEAYYQAILKTTGLDYTGLFRGMKQIRRTQGFSSAIASWPAEDVGSSYLAHPGVLDVALQAILATVVNPTRIPIRGSWLPSACSRLIFDPRASFLTHDNNDVAIESDCFLTKNTARSVEGDIHVFGPSGRCIIQTEGFRMDNWTPSSAEKDRPVFSRIEYQPDLFYANGSGLPELVPDDAELRLIEAINRACVYYLRQGFSTVPESEVAEWTWDRQAFYRVAKRLLQQTAEGKHPVAPASWLNDSAALMEQYKQDPAFKDQVDMRAIHIAGENLAQIMAGKERALELYIREGIWARLYSHGRFQIRLNHTIADLVRRFAHRYPRANILEVGGGSAGTTLGILNQLGDALGQYTFTDISAGFFEKARERLSPTNAAAAGRVVYKVLDLERDPLEQGFEAESQDVVIAVNVLHATADIRKSIQHVRRLLKPGGYLFMMEVTGEYLEGTLLMGPLEGWWLGNREGDADQPGLKLQAWDDTLRETGFTGVDMHQSDIPDPVQHAVSVIVSQASDSRIDMLREPLEFLDDIPIVDQVLIIGGHSLAMSKTIRSISQSVSRFAGRVQVVPSVDQVDHEVHLSGPTAVIALCELEKPFFSEPITETRLKKLQALFACATDMLWVTPGHLDNEHPSSAMMIGLCRTLVIELENINLQFLNTTTKGTKPSDARLIVETFARLRLGGAESFAKSPILWSNELELTVSDVDEILIPRLKPDTERNSRLNSAERHITKAVTFIDKTDAQLTAVPRDGHIQVEEIAPWQAPAKRQQQAQLANFTTLHTALSVSLPQSSAVLLAGYDQDNRQVMALASAHCINASVANDHVLYLKTGIQCTAQQLRVCAHTILAKHILAAIPSLAASKPTIVIHGASAALARLISQLANEQKRIFFTESTARTKSNFPDATRLHPRSSNHILRQSLPPNISFVVNLDKGDTIGDKLVSIFPGATLDLDALASNGKALTFAELAEAIVHIMATDDADEGDSIGQTHSDAMVPAHLLSDLPLSSLSYPAVVDWSVDSDHPLQVTITPISSHGMFSPDSTYFMVSLVSTLGRSICRWMVENGARNIALASRSANVDPQWLQEMAQLGANIRVYRMDVTDKASVQSTVATIRAEMPPIVGVANAALVLRDRQFLDMELADITEVLAPKVDGSCHLHEEFQDPSLDFFILFSTLSCVIGNAGQSNYDAASLYQVMLAKQRRLKGLPASVMDVGCVADVGYVAERGQALFDKLARTMKLPLSESDMHQIFAEAVAASPVREGEVVDSTTAELVTGMGYYRYSPNTRSEAHPPWFNNQLTSHFVREDQASNAVSTAAGAHHISIVAQLDATKSEQEATAVLTQALANRIETMLQMAPGNFKVDASLLDVGIDSLLAVELRTWFLKQVLIDVPVLKILSGDSAETVCAFAASQYLAEKSNSSGETPPPVANASYTEDCADSRQADAQPPSDKVSIASDSSSSEAGPSELATSVSTVDSDDGEKDREAKAHLLPKLQETGPMTRAQARIWIADHISSNHAQDNNVLTYDLHGIVNVARLRRAVASVVAHHPGLHTCFFQDSTNTPRQGVLEVPLERFKYIHSSGDSSKVVERVQDELSSRKWQLELGEALEVILISHSSKQHTLLIGFHHIAMDGSTWQVFFRDLDMAYQGVALQAAGKSLIEIAKGQSNKVADRSGMFWQEQFTPPPEPLPLLPFSSTKTRPNLDACTNHKSLAKIDGATVERINATSRSLRFTPVNFYLAAVQYLMSRLADVEEICVGVTDSGRDTETADTLGFFINILPLRLQANNLGSFKNLAKQVNSTYREARIHSSVPFETILETAAASRDPTCTPLFQICFDLRPGQTVDIPLGNCRLRGKDLIDSKVPYDITFCVTPMPTSGPSYVQIITRSDLYSREATDLLTSMYVTLLESAVQSSTADTDQQLQIYPRAGIQKALDFGVPKSVDIGNWPSTLTERFEQMCQEHAGAIAVKDVSGSLKYTNLSLAVKSLSAHLLPHRGSRIAVLCEPQREWIVGMLAIFRIGATFVSLDTTLPPARLTAMIRACECDVLLHTTAMQPLAADTAEGTSVAHIIPLQDVPTLTHDPVDMHNHEDPSKASLILCTSGTTGLPKAILLSSRGFLNFLAHQAEVHGVQPGEVVLQQSGLGFDMALAQAMLALMHGCTLVIAPQSSRGDPVAITGLMVQEDVSLTFACPTEYLMWLRYGCDNLSRLNRWRLAYSGGEKVPAALRKGLAKVRCSPLHADAYGPTEISICVTMEHGDETIEDPLTVAAASVGCPLPNVGIFILDSHGDICPPGVPGEVCITGVGVALGYVDADATAKSFVDNHIIKYPDGAEFPSGRMYRTGDQGVWRKDGTLGFLGRKVGDTVVKIRGLRTDLTDVENTILTEGSHMIADAIVTTFQHHGDISLLAHVVLKDITSIAEASNNKEHPSDNVLEAHLEDFMQRLALPQHMKPGRVIVHTKMPVVASGKVDRRRLADFPLTQRKEAIRPAKDIGSMTTLTQVQLHLIWQRVLDRIDIPRLPTVDFWAMGGSSLDLAKLQAAIATEMLVKLSIRDMFKHSTLGGMADLISNRATDLPSLARIDWDQETKVPEDVKTALIAPDSKIPPAKSCKEVLLTGANTFLGGHVLRRLLQDPAIERVHCVAVHSLSKLSGIVDTSRIVVYEGSTLHLPNLGLDDDTSTYIFQRVDRIIIAGGHGHCLHNYISLRQSNVASVKFLATCAAPRRIPLHFISSSRVTLLAKDSQAELPPVSVRRHQPDTDGSEGLTACKWVAEVLLERMAEEAAKSGSGMPITIHRPCALIGDEAPSEDALNSILRFSALMGAVPQLSKLPVSGYIDFAPVEDIAMAIVDTATHPEQPSHIRFRHHSGGVKIRSDEFKEHFEKIHGKQFAELELEEWITRAQELGIEPMIAIYLRAVFADGRKIEFPFMGQSEQR